jgi:hypothetical protein
LARRCLGRQRLHRRWRYCTLRMQWRRSPSTKLVARKKQCSWRVNSAAPASVPAFLHVYRDLRIPLRTWTRPTSPSSLITLHILCPVTRLYLTAGRCVTKPTEYRSPPSHSTLPRPHLIVPWLLRPCMASPSGRPRWCPLPSTTDYRISTKASARETA